MRRQDPALQERFLNHWLPGRERWPRQSVLRRPPEEQPQTTKPQAGEETPDERGSEAQLARFELAAHATDNQWSRAVRRGADGLFCTVAGRVIPRENHTLVQRLMSKKAYEEICSIRLGHVLRYRNRRHCRRNSQP